MTRSRPRDDSSAAEGGPAPLPGAAQLAAIAELWKRSHRIFEARFDGRSMTPTIEPQQPVTVRCGEAVKVDAVILAFRNHDVIVHRVVWISRRGDWLLTRGDARAIPDPPLAMSNIVGVVDAPPFTPRRTQRIALRIVSAVARFGRHAAHLAVRTLQIAARVRQRVE